MTKLATRMARLGQVNEFNPEKETISAYLERVEMFFLANDIHEDKKVPVLLSVIGATTYALLRNLVTPDTPKDKDFATLSKLSKDHYEPTPIVDFIAGNKTSEKVSPSTSPNLNDSRRTVSSMASWNKPYVTASYSE